MRENQNRRTSLALSRIVALYHFTAQVIRRSAGRSVVQCAAYRSGGRLYDERLGRTFDFSTKPVVHSEILAPEGSPAWVFDRERLWNAVEGSDNRVNLQLAREFEIAIPRELEPENRIELVREWIREEFVSRGMIADVGFHEEEPGKPHFHLLLTMRRLHAETGEFGPKAEAAEWDKKPLFLHWKQSWAVYANRALQREGHDVRIDHRSYAERGLDLEPQPKIGRAREDVLLDGRDVVQSQLEKYQQVAFENGERIRQDPTIALRLLTQQQATFSRESLLKVLHTHTRDAEQFDRCLAAVLASPEIVRLGGDDLERVRFTTREMLACENQLLEVADALRGDATHRVTAARVEQAAAAKASLSGEQRRALEHLTSESGAIALLEGHAGTGKSFMLDAARLAWEAEGYSVVGAALAGKAAEGLQLEANIPSHTLASWQHAWQRGQRQLSARHILVIDEAGMIGTRQLAEVLAEAQACGAKVVLVGDSRQLQAIDAGAPFRVLAHHVGAETLSEIRRQRVDWQREASVAFAGGRGKEALGAYHAHGSTHELDTRASAREAMVEAWAEHRATAPTASALLLAYRNEDTQALNRLARESRIAAGELGPSLVVQTENGPRELAIGDRIYFGKNDRTIGVTNGSLGVLEHFEQGVGGGSGTLAVRLDSGRYVAVDLEAYNQVDHGYAVTVHKAQGVTVDRTFVLADELWDSSGTYVAMTRHRAGVDLYWSKEQFRDRDHLDRVLTRERPKEMALEQVEALREQLEQVEVPPPATAPPAAPSRSFDERFAELSTEDQKKVLHAVMRESALAQQRQKLLTVGDVYERLPEVRDAAALLQKAQEHYAASERQLSEYRQLPWYKQVLDGNRMAALEEQLVSARGALSAAHEKQAAVGKDPVLRKRVERHVETKNRPVAELIHRIRRMQKIMDDQAHQRRQDQGRAHKRTRDRDPDRGGWGR